MYKRQALRRGLPAVFGGPFHLHPAADDPCLLYTSSLILLLLFLLLVKILHVAHSSRDDLGKYICFGYFGIIALQSISNIGMCRALLPVMGVTLPFFSAGGSSAACMYFGIGLVQSVYMRRKESDGLRLKRKLPMRIPYGQMKET